MLFDWTPWIPLGLLIFFGGSAFVVYMIVRMRDDLRYRR